MTDDASGSGNATAATTTTQQNDDSNNTGDRNSGNNRSTGGRGYNRHGRKTNINSAGKNFKGSKPKLNIVMGLPTEALLHGGPFSQIQEKFDEYVMKKFDRGIDIKKLIVELRSELG